MVLRDRPAPNFELRAATFNIRQANPADGENRWERRRELALDVISSIAPDVLGVQEAFAFQLDELRDGLASYRAFGEGRDGGRMGEHSALLVREDVRVCEHGDFWLSETPEVAGSIGWDASCARMATWAVLDGPPSCMVLNTHLDHRGPAARLHSAELIAGQVASRGLPSVVMGDMNALEASEPMRAFAQAGLRDVWGEAHPGEKGATFNGFGKTAWAERIDYILCSREWVVLDAEVTTAPQGRYASDHYPLTARLRLGD
jgi:endonuclease/exonuclease/phosphatase family metal-dependent hydrolase